MTISRQPLFPASKYVSAQQQHGACFRLRERRADSAAMTSHEVELQSLELRRRNVDVGESTEASVDAVNDAPFIEHSIDHGARSAHIFPRGCG